MLLSHLNALAFLVGYGLFGYGIALWSIAAAFVLLGSVLMIVACWPWLTWPARKKP